MLKFATKGRFLSDEGNPLPLFTFKFYSSSSCYLFHDSCRKDLSRICKLLNTLLCCGKFGYTSDSSYAAVWCLGPKLNTPSIAAFSDRQWHGLKGFAMNCFSCNCRCVCNKTFKDTSTTVSCGNGEGLEVGAAVTIPATTLMWCQVTKRDN